MNFWFIKSFPEILFLYIFAKIPSELEIGSDISDGHMIAQGKNKPFQGSGTSTLLPGKGNWYLPDDPATATPDPLHRHFDIYRHSADGNSPDHTPDNAFPGDITTFTGRTPQ